MANWDALTSYPKLAIVTRVGVSWTSLQDGNLGHPPETSIGFWLLKGPREQVLSAVTAVLLDGLGLPVERNSPEPANLVEAGLVVVQVDGEEEKPEVEHDTGVIVHTTGVEIECYVSTPDQDPGPFANDLAERTRGVVLRERDLDPNEGRPFANRKLGALLYGNVEIGFGLPHFDGLEEGRTPFEVYRVAGSEHGAVATVEFYLKYGVRPDNPWILLRPGEGDR